MGNILIIVLSAITLILYFVAKGQGAENFDLILVLSQVSALLGSVLLSLNYMLSTRFNFVDKMFGGLDKVYKAHGILGALSFFLVVNHPLLLIIEALPFNLSRLYLLPSSNLSYTLGILALYTLTILIFLTLFVDLPYKLWKKTHEWMGVVIIFGSLHGFLVSSDISEFAPLKFWILGLNALAIMAFVYKRYVYYWITPKGNYKIEEINHQKNYLLLKISPSKLTKPVHFEPGQFAFFSLPEKNEDEHPFSIMEQIEGNIWVGIKTVGKFTLNLSQLKTGDLITVRGPFGNFGRSLKRHKKMLWISAGIGITPFLSMIKQASPDQEITMIHCGRSTDPSLYTDLFKNYTYYFPNFKFAHHLTDQLGRINNQIISKIVDTNQINCVYTCGPINMMQQLLNELPKLGIKKRKIIFEDFSLK